jgi:hypothetical protein
MGKIHVLQRSGLLTLGFMWERAGTNLLLGRGRYQDIIYWGHGNEIICILGSSVCVYRML